MRAVAGARPRAGIRNPPQGDPEPRAADNEGGLGGPESPHLNHLTWAVSLSPTALSLSPIAGSPVLTPAPACSRTPAGSPSYRSRCVSPVPTPGSVTGPAPARRRPRASAG